MFISCSSQALLDASLGRDGTRATVVVCNLASPASVGLSLPASSSERRL
jgi:hypothetical protein